jgi:hypothetical protein
MPRLFGGVLAMKAWWCCGLDPRQYLQDQHHPNKVRCQHQELSHVVTGLTLAGMVFGLEPREYLQDQHHPNKMCFRK